MSEPLAPIQSPDLITLLQQWRDEIFTSFRCHQVGTIISFDAATQAARVSLNVLCQVGDRTVSYPMLVDVPVFINTGGRAGVTFPIGPGDTCIVGFNDRDLDNWFATGSTSVPNSLRAHSLADGMAFVGIRSKRNPIPGYDNANAVLYNGQGKVIVRDQPSTLDLDALVGLSNASGSLLDLINLVIAALTQLNAKTGPSAVTQIAAVQAAAVALLK